MKTYLLTLTHCQHTDYVIRVNANTKHEAIQKAKQLAEYQNLSEASLVDFYESYLIKTKVPSFVEQDNPNHQFLIIDLQETK